VDFTVEVERSLRVLDGAVAVFDSVAGVQPQSETVWRQADRYGVPRIAFINKMDRTGADFDAAVQSMRDRLGARPVPIHLPIGSEENFSGIVDLVEMKAITYGNTLGTELTVEEIPAELADAAHAGHHELIDLIAEFDDELMETYLEDEASVTPEMIRHALRKGTLAGAITPVLAGSAFKNKGVQALLDAIVDYLPSPLDVPPVQGIDPKSEAEETRAADDEAPFAALAFKVMSDPYVGKLTYFRVYSGQVKAGDRVLNTTNGKTERIGRILQMHANHREEREEIGAGEIAAAVGLKFTTTGDTLAVDSAPIVLESMSFPTRTSSRPPSSGSPRRIRPSASHPTRRPGRRSSRGWVNCTSRSSSTACSANSRSTATSVARRSPTARRSRAPRRRSRAGSCVRRAARASTATSSSTSTRTRPRATSSRTRSSAARSRRSTSPLSTTASRRQ
jgi:elongation factor G